MQKKPKNSVIQSEVGRDMMNKIIKAIELMSEFAGKLAYYLIIPLTLIVFYTIIMRRFFGNYPDWGFESTIFLFGIMILLSGADTLRTKGHISVDIIQQYIKGKPAQVLNVFITGLIIVIAVLLMWKGIDLSLESTMIQERSAHQTSFNPPIWWFKWFIPLAGLLLLLQALVELYKVIGREGKQWN